MSQAAIINVKSRVSFIFAFTTFILTYELIGCYSKKTKLAIV